MKASDDLEYRLDLPDPHELSGDGMTIADMNELFNEVDALGRKKNAKHNLFAEAMNDWHFEDLYVFFRQFTDRFAHPERALGIGTATMDAAAAQAFDAIEDSDHASELRDEYDGSLSRALKGEAIGKDGDDVLVIDLFQRQLEIEQASGDGTITNLVADMFERVRHPWVWSIMVGDDCSFYCSDSVVVNAVKVAADDHTASIFDKEWGVNDDGPLVFYYWSHPDHEVTGECLPHCMIGEMKATKCNSKQAARIEDNDEDWIAQTKYDGARLFIHHAGDGDVRAYMAGNKDVTAQLPELFEEPIVSQFPEFPFVLDSEVVPYDSDTGEVLPFQHILKRTGRETDEMLESGAGGIDVQFKLFDVLNWRGNDISRHPYEERLEVLRAAFTPDVVARTGTDFEAIYNASLDNGHEGVVLKKMDSHFEYLIRSKNWYKWKADPMEADVRIAHVHEGSGKAANTVGAITMQVRDEVNESWNVVGAVGTGWTDRKADELWELHQHGSLVGRTMQVSFEELQVSDGEYALRFPSFDALRPEGEPDSLRRLARMADIEIDDL